MVSSCRVKWHVRLPGLINEGTKVNGKQSRGSWRRGHVQSIQALNRLSSKILCIHRRPTGATVCLSGTSTAVLPPLASKILLCNPCQHGNSKGSNWRERVVKEREKQKNSTQNNNPHHH